MAEIIRDDFKPNLTPIEVLLSGAFGGAYFGRRVLKGDYDYQSLFQETLKDIPTTLYLQPKYNTGMNKFKVKSGMPYDYWKEKGWMHNDDPYGWFEWYLKYYNGRRHSDDDRQINRWKGVCGIDGRWRKIIYRKIYDSNNWNISPRIQQSLLHWGYRVNEEDYHLWCAMTNHKYKEVEWCAYGGLPSPAAYE